MKEYCTLARHIPASLCNNFYIVNIHMFTYETELQLKPDFLPEISNICIFRHGACEQSGYNIEGTGNNSLLKRDFREDAHDPV